MKSFKLLASAPDADKLTALISRFYCGEPITLRAYGIVENSAGEISGVRWIKTRGRYRFEMETEK